eukprot:TRINITY_DN18264_c0_g1_i1.p1 TRINITY_DN18264_c0_g1~~TRINITY_DN18264_c0_g1_i1.p1  ORF type:complete len:198 (+),score=27.91 TRINITY_DN18264_c0_g1_i1:59-595(+)
MCIRDRQSTWDTKTQILMIIEESRASIGKFTYKVDNETQSINTIRSWSSFKNSKVDKLLCIELSGHQFFMLSTTNDGKQINFEFFEVSENNVVPSSFKLLMEGTQTSCVLERGNMMVFVRWVYIFDCRECQVRFAIYGWQKNSLWVLASFDIRDYPIVKKRVREAMSLHQFKLPFDFI